MTTTSSTSFFPAAMTGASVLLVAVGCSEYTVKALSVSEREGCGLAEVVRVAGALNGYVGALSFHDRFLSKGTFLTVVGLAAAAVVVASPALHGEVRVKSGWS